MPLLFTTDDEEERSLKQTGEYIQPVHREPSVKRLNELFRIVDHKLHWYIDSTHTAPTGVSCNVDGTIVSAEWILKRIGPKLSTGVSFTPDNRFRARCTIDGKRINLGYFPTEEAAANAIAKLKA